MKKFTTLAILLLLCMVGLFAQAPEKFTYQAVVRFANNSLAANTQIGVRISILQGSVVGEAVFVETHIVNSNANGLITLEIGSGNVQVGSISNIDWSNGLYFLRTETDPYGGIDYIVTSTQQLMSVPYALYAKEAGNGFSGDYNDLTNTPVIPIVPSDVSAFNNDAGYLTSFTEQQVLSISNDTVFLTGGSFVKLPAAASSFSGDYNDLVNKPTIPTVPTNVSAFTNDAGYLTGYTETDPLFTAWDKDYNDLTNKPEIPTVPSNVSAFTNDAGYLTSFTEQQVLTISNDTIFLTGGSFVKLPAATSSFSGDYNDLINKPEIPTIPTDVSVFNNDANYVTVNQLNAANYITAADVPVQVNADWDATSGVAQILNKPELFDGDYNSLTNTPSIPTTVSELTNDANYITIEDVPAQVNADWNATEGAAQILNKPTNVSAFTNDAGYITAANVQEAANIPTNVSAFNNDAGYITSEDIPEIPTVPTNVSAFNNDAGYLTEYTEQQVLSISNDTLFLTGGSYVKLPAGFDGDYNSLTNKPTIPTVPTNVSAFTNDAGYITGTDIPAIPTVPTNVSAFTNDAGYLTEYTEQQVLSISNDTLFLTGGSYVKLPAGFDGDYNSLTNKPTIPTVPTNVSAFTNDAGYITAANVQEAANIPTNVSAFTNDAGYITSEDIPEIPTVPTNVSAFNNDAGYLTSFTEQQVLSISNDTLFLTGGSFVKLPAGFDGDYNSLTNKPEIPTIPTDVSAFNNDAGYIVNNNPACSNTVNLCELQNKINELDSLLHLINELPSTPTVLTTGVTAISTTSFTVNGEVVMAGGSTVSERGFVYGLTSNPTIYNNKKNVGSGLGTFTATISGLQAGHTYYVRAFATNTNGTAYGSQMTVTTNTQAPSTLPIVNTVAVVNVTNNEATVSANVMSDGGETVTQRGFVYDTLPNPTTSNNVAYHGTGTGHYSNLLTGLLSGKTYYVRAFATNSVGTAYGNEISFTTNVPSPVSGDAIPCPNTPTVTDHEGNVYNTVKIGTQCWTKENMRATTSPSTGTYLIPPAGTTHTCSGKQARWYNDDSTTYAPRNYGLLYNWNAAVDTFDVEYGEISMNGNNGFGIFINGNRRGICPEGWHVPSSTEWDQLAEYLNSHAEYRSGNVYGYAAKSLASTIDWNACSTPYTIGNDLTANNAAGFNALPAGQYNNDDYYHTIGTHAWFWSTNYSANGAHAHSCIIENISPNVRVDHAYAVNLCSCISVRCLRDIPCTEPVDTTGGGSTPVDTTTAPADTTTSATHGIPCPGTPTVTDIDGNTYNTVQIGEQCWMRENLRSLHYADGTQIDYGAYESSYYPNTVYYLDVALMNGAESSNSIPSGVQGPCPNGWHLPSKAEWEVLISYVSNQFPYYADSLSILYASPEGWPGHNGNLNPGYNRTGFSATPSGSAYYGAIEGEVNYSVLSSCTRLPDPSYFYVFNVNIDENRAEIAGGHAGWYTVAVRCLRDIPCTDEIDTTSGGTTPVDTTTTPADTTTSATHGTPCPGTPTVTDIDGNTYNTVQIGDQCWMKENLRTTHYENGDEIVNGGHSWMSYDDPLGYFIGPSDLIYGYYYNGKAAVDPRNICPQGWHVPSDAEWTQLTDYIRSQSNFLCLGNSNHIAKAMILPVE